MSVPKPAARAPESLSRLAGARREEILDVALELFSRRGFHETSISDIAGRAHVSRATVYQHFRDKRDVLAAIAQRVERGVLAAIDAWRPLPDAPRDGCEASELIDRLRAMIDTRIAQLLTAATAQNVAATRLVLRSIRGQDDPIREATRRIEAHVLEILTTDVQAAIRFGWARECDAKTIALFVLGGIEKLLFRILDADETPAVSQPSVVEEIGAFVFFGLAGAALSQPDVPRLPHRKKGPTRTKP
jgi:AcrR family transcriptional regulator